MRPRPGEERETMALYAVMITFGDKQLRDQVRTEHRVFLQEQLDAGTLVESGPWLDDSGALLVYEAETEAALYELLAQDPYWWNIGIIANETVKEWNRVFARD